MLSDFFRRKGARDGSVEYYFDYSLLIATLFLLAFGWIMIYSVSSYSALANDLDAAYFMIRQVAYSGIGIVGMLVVSFFPYDFWRKFAWIGYGLSLFLVILVPIIGEESHGAKRWIKIPGIGIQFQPAEVVKLCIILLMAHMVSRFGKNMKLLRSFMFLLVLTLLAGGMVWKLTDNLSSGIIVVGIGIFMMFVASPNYKLYIGLATAGGILIGIVLTAISKMEMSEELGFRFKRILAWMNPEAYADDTGFQTIQALYAIGSGGVLGKGLGQSMQKKGFVPEAQNDMIFSIICEELGLFGAFLVILLFALLLWRMMIIATNAPDLFGSLLVVGVMGHIAIQVILNIAVVTNTIPNTGISLPFISYGGTAIIMQLVEMGLVFSVARRIQLREY